MIVLVTPFDGGPREIVEVTRIEEKPDHSRAIRSRVTLFDSDQQLGEVDLNQARVEILPRAR